MAATNDDIDRAREMMRELTGDLKMLAEHPEIIDSWTPAQRAWTMENMELLVEQLKDLKGNIEEMIE